MAANLKDIANLFAGQGARFILAPEELAARLAEIKAFLFDWDGVFNDGVKDGEGGSPFSEADSMGINMLRFGYYRQTGVVLPVFLVTGEHNRPAFYLAGREHFPAAFRQVPDKVAVLEVLEREYGLLPEELAFVFDDILDLGLAARVGLRICVNRPGSPLLQRYIRQEKLADYLTAMPGSGHAVREVSELCLGLLGEYEPTIAERQVFHPRYRAYLAARNQVTTRYFTARDGQVVPIRPD